MQGKSGGSHCNPVLHITELFQTKVVGKFVEFHGEGASSWQCRTALQLNMAPEYGATTFFPVDEKTSVSTLQRPDEATKSGRTEPITTAQKMFGIPEG